MKLFANKRIKKPEVLKVWTTLFFGDRGSCKTLHQAKIVVLKVIPYLNWLYSKKVAAKKFQLKGVPLPIKKTIIFSVQKFNKDIDKRYAVFSYDDKEVIDEDGKKHLEIDFSTKKINNPDGYIYYWNPDDPETLRYCPRPSCWRGEEKHRLHGCLLIFDDMATILPADGWANTPLWLRKMFAQARHFGIHILGNAQDPFSCDINFRRYTDICYRFTKLFGSRDPDETQPPVRFIFGLYVTKKIKASLLWKFGNMSDEEIDAQKEMIRQQNKVNNTHLYANVWKASPHWLGRKACELYDTTQDVPEFRPQGFSHEVLYCIDPSHNHKNKRAKNYCGYKKIYHELI